MSSASRWAVCGGDVGKEVERVDWMVWRRERRGGGRVFGGGVMVFGGGDLLACSDLPVEGASFVGVPCLSSSLSLLELSSFVVASGSSWDSDFIERSRLADMFSSSCDDGTKSCMGIRGKGKSL